MKKMIMSGGGGRRKKKRRDDNFTENHSQNPMTGKQIMMIMMKNMVQIERERDFRRYCYNGVSDMFHLS